MAARRLAITHHGRQVAFSVLAEALPGFQQMLGIQPGFYALGQFDFTGGVEQRRLADAVQIDAHEVRRGALSIQIAVNPACGGPCGCIGHSDLPIGLHCHGV
ncbi:Uncharacterised protein [Mycobacterium tuberculosis]|uniref:Uncharacterized protein n=1 Tax=Mycobacterium tuberculosis TaxID=1773 RepID=A0A655AGG2_MYCTX|nr:Uncharacterised protein [Mycobacterium tuberculosis]CFR93972.1 Uncharacterised protein [Mycobacterium tuberculosis]CKR47184.1 Uncharacterised protein [Mycobacterium tuberculosis]CKT17219.1 Uncharacterised protein [Mycobacterium tuberculosis]CKT79881.1 Uncharacterised protein [Mycobacterium tuberculosis]